MLPLEMKRSKEASDLTLEGMLFEEYPLFPILLDSLLAVASSVTVSLSSMSLSIKTRSNELNQGRCNMIDYFLRGYSHIRSDRSLWIPVSQNDLMTAALLEVLEVLCFKAGKLLPIPGPEASCKGRTLMGKLLPL